RIASRADVTRSPTSRSRSASVTARGYRRLFELFKQANSTYKLTVLCKTMPGPTRGEAASGALTGTDEGRATAGRHRRRGQAHLIEWGHGTPRPTGRLPAGGGPAQDGAAPVHPDRPLPAGELGRALVASGPHGAGAGRARPARHRSGAGDGD